MIASVGQNRQTCNISRTLVGNKIADPSDVVGVSPVGAAPTTSSFSTLQLAWIGQRQLEDETRKIQVLRFGATYIRDLTVVFTIHHTFVVSTSTSTDEFFPCPSVLAGGPGSTSLGSVTGHGGRA